MRSRCTCASNAQFANYGGRGITVCERWGKFENFLADMGRRPSNGHSLDRIDNSKGYTPENCRWATSSQQNRNKRPYKARQPSEKKILVTHDGRTQTVSAWLAELGMTYMGYKRRRLHGSTIEQAATAPKAPPGPPPRAM